MLLTALFAKIFLKKTFLKNKKDRDADKVQTISRPLCLTVTVTRLFIGCFPITSAGFFPQSKNIRDMKPCSACLRNYFNKLFLPLQ